MQEGGSASDGEGLTEGWRVMLVAEIGSWSVGEGRGKI